MKRPSKSWSSTGDCRIAGTSRCGWYEKAWSQIALDLDDEEYIRDAAFISALVVAGITHQEYPKKRRLPDFEAKADWRLLARLVEGCGAEVPERLRVLAAG